MMHRVVTFSTSAWVVLVSFWAITPNSAQAQLWRVDFESPTASSLMTGDETMAASASSRFNSPTGVWNGPNNAPDNANFTMSLGPQFDFPLLEANGGTSIQMTFTAGTARVASFTVPGLMPLLFRDMWAVDFTNNGVPGSVNEFLEWKLTGLTPNAEYEMFAYGGWPDASFPFEVDEDIIYWLDKDADGDFADDPLLEVGLGPMAGPHGDHITGIMSSGSGEIRGRWKGDPNTGFIGHTQGFQLAQIGGGSSNEHQWIAQISQEEWDRAQNWDAAGVAPQSDWHAILINNQLAGGKTAIVDSDSTVQQVSVGGGDFPMTVHIDANQTLSASQGANLSPNGVLAGSGTMVGNVVNGGLVRVGSIADDIDVHWIAMTPEGDWGNGQNWDANGTSPQSNWHAILMNAQTPGGLTALVNGNTTVHQVEIGGNHPMTVRLVQNATMQTDDGVNIATNGVLAGRGTVVGQVTNGGVLAVGDLANSAAAAVVSGMLETLDAPSSRLTAVPEPAGWYLALITGLSLINARRRGRVPCVRERNQ